jgi:hypothetical protein
VAAGADRDAPTMDVFEPSDSTAPKATDEDVDVPRAELPQLPLL